MKISIQNFKGISAFNGEIGNSVISGKNKEGKTTILSAVAWLLTGYDLEESDNPKVQQEGKTLDLETKVECEIAGKTLARTFSEKWVKNRQTLEREFKGNESKYFLDGELVKKEEFDGFIEQFKIDGLTLRESIFSFIVPSYFTEILDEKKRSKVVYDNIR